MMQRLFILLFATLGFQAQATCLPAGKLLYSHEDHDIDAHHGGESTMVAFVSSDSDTSRRNAPEHGDSGTQLRQGTDMAIHVSLAPAVDSGFSLLAVIYCLTHYRVPDRVNTIAHQPNFNVLFRVIISRNAP